MIRDIEWFYNYYYYFVRRTRGMCTILIGARRVKRSLAEKAVRVSSDFIATERKHILITSGARDAVIKENCECATAHVDVIGM